MSDQSSFSRIFSLVAPFAIQSRRPWVGVPDLAMALLDGRPDNQAAELLTRAGMSHDTTTYLKSNISSMDEADNLTSPEFEGSLYVRPTPAFYEVAGRAEGIALGQHAGRVSSLHILASILCAQTDYLLLEETDIDKREVRRLLSSRAGIILDE